MVYDIKKANPEIEIIINGAITDTKDIKQHLNKVDGVMIGRAIYQSPYFLADIERDIFNNNNILSREEIVQIFFVTYIFELTITSTFFELFTQNQDHQFFN